MVIIELGRDIQRYIQPGVHPGQELAVKRQLLELTKGCGWLPVPGEPLYLGDDGALQNSLDDGDRLWTIVPIVLGTETAHLGLILDKEVLGRLTAIHFVTAAKIGHRLAGTMAEVEGAAL